MFFLVLCFYLPHFMLGLSNNDLCLNGPVQCAAFGDNVTLKCIILQDANQGTQRWRKDGDVIATSKTLSIVHQMYKRRFRVEYNKDKGEFNLLLWNFMESDIGTYICDIQTTVGINQQHIVLIVLKDEKNLKNYHVNKKSSFFKENIYYVALEGGLVVVLFLSVGCNFYIHKRYIGKQMNVKRNSNQENQYRANEDLSFGGTVDGFNQYESIDESNMRHCDYPTEGDIEMIVNTRNFCLNNQPSAILPSLSTLEDDTGLSVNTKLNLTCNHGKKRSEDIEPHGGFSNTLETKIFRNNTASYDSERMSTASSQGNTNTMQKGIYT